MRRNVILSHSSTLVERKSFIRSFVKKVRVTGTEALMTYTIPMPPKQLSQEILAVPPIVHYGGRYCTIGGTFKLTFSLT